MISDGVRDIVGDGLATMQGLDDFDALMTAVITFTTGVSDDLQRKDGSAMAIECAAGCAFCCHNYEVHLSALELIWLARHLNDAVDPETRADIENRAIDMAHKKPDNNGGPMPLHPCPMLNPASGRCRVYDTRPLVCRGQNSVDVAACKSRQESGVDRAEGIRGSAVQRLVAHAALAGLRRALMERGADDMVLDLTRGVAFLAANQLDLSDVLLTPETLSPAKAQKVS